jgi:Transmembrane exosortase (Exosortase_EpsH)
VRHRNLLALLFLIAWLYASILVHLFLQWISDKDFSHGIFVPIFALYVIWLDRKKLNAIPATRSWAGLPLVVVSMFVLVLGVLGADIFLPRVSLIILLAGVIILFQGVDVLSRRPLSLGVSDSDDPDPGPDH